MSTCPKSERQNRELTLPHESAPGVHSLRLHDARTLLGWLTATGSRRYAVSGNVIGGIWIDRADGI